jgi:peptidoglycan/xylan/chitin deacetylase (PgdA/CDA1 family)
MSVEPYGTGANSEIGTENLRSMAITLTKCQGWTITFDSFWTGFASKAVFVPGCDESAQSCVDIALPIFNEYGWKGYICAPRSVLPNPTTATYADLNADPAYKTLTPIRTLYPAMSTMYDAGWDVINHSLSHRSLGYLTNPAEIQMEIERPRAWAVAGGLVRGSEFYASPNSSTSRLAQTVIAGCGMVLQRHSVKVNNSLTPWGFDNPNSLGSHDLGGVVAGQSVALLKNIIDNICRYGDVWWPFWHKIRTLGDPGDGSGIYVVDGLNIYESNFRRVAAHMRQKELAGEASVLSPTQLYYGA